MASPEIGTIVRPTAAEEAVADAGEKGMRGTTSRDREALLVRLASLVRPGRRGAASPAFLRGAALALVAMTASGCQTLDAPGPKYLPAVPSIGGVDDLKIGPPPKTLDQVTVPKMEKFDAKEMTEVRRDGLREAALAYGSQMGYARRAWEIEKTLQARSTALSEAFSFDRVTIAAPRQVGFIVPPVVSRAFAPYEIDGDGMAASAADEYLEIVSPARLAPVVPTWRDYLLIAAGEPEEPAGSLLPRNKDEQAIFERWLKTGWNEGVRLADDSFEEKVNRLQRDFEGMLQYRRLVALNMIDEMVVADADFGTVAEEDGSAMRIGERTVTIVSAARLAGDEGRWRPVLVNARWKEITDKGSINPDAAHTPVRPAVKRKL